MTSACKDISEDPFFVHGRLWFPFALSVLVGALMIAYRGVAIGPRALPLG